MRTTILAIGLAGLASAAEAKIPFFNATCPGDISVHADEGGPIYVNGKEGKLKTFNDDAYEASHGDVVISLTISPDGSPSVSYTGPDRANGVCAVEAAGSAGAGAGGCPVDVSEADRSKYPACN